MKKPVYPGEQYGYLTILEVFPLDRCTARCVCGVVKNFRSHNIGGGNTKSCGCMRHKLRLASAGWEKYTDEGIIKSEAKGARKSRLEDKAKDYARILEAEGYSESDASHRARAAYGFEKPRTIGAISLSQDLRASIRVQCCESRCYDD
jgi:hypothetical protein